jgi:hypothetical protein
MELTCDVATCNNTLDIPPMSPSPARSDAGWSRITVYDGKPISTSVLDYDLCPEHTRKINDILKGP